MKLKKNFEEDLLVSCFSFNGTINRLGFLGFFLLLSIINSHIPYVVFPFFSVIIFYATLAVTQKRCRDFNYNGTIFIVLYSLMYAIIFCHACLVPNIKPFKEFLNKHEYCAFVHDGVLYTYLFSLLLLALIPGRKKKDLTLRSPLLKHPWKYVAFCYGIYIICLAVLIYWRHNYMHDA